MGDEGKKIDKQLLMHIFGMAKKGGMREPILEELLDVVREQAKIDEEAVKQQAATYVNPPYDLKSLGLNQQGTTPVTFDQMLADANRTGWKDDDQWDCFIEYGARGGSHARDACQEAQKIADDQEVPVRLNFNDTHCILYPNGKWEEGLESWWEARNQQDRARSQAKIANFSMSPMNFVRSYVKADADATMKMHVLKNRTVPESQKPDHFFGAIRDFLGDDD